jgi:replication-associated recombination protein RarA
MTTRNSLKEAIKKAKQHYDHACKKHPFFADDVCSNNIWCNYENDAKYLKNYLEYQNHLHENPNEESYCMAKDVLDAELAEIYATYCNGDYDQAVEEIYDAIAVLLRMEDMIKDKKREDSKCQA